MNVFQFLITCKRTNNANNATHYVKLGKTKRESSKRNYYILSPKGIMKAIIIITRASARAHTRTHTHTHTRGGKKEENDRKRGGGEKERKREGDGFREYRSVGTEEGRTF